MSRFMQREKVKRIITGLTFDLKTKERKEFSFVPAIPNKPKDVLAYARKKLETSPTTRVLKAEYTESSDLYITLTKLFMLKSRALKDKESKNGLVTYTVNYMAVDVMAMDLETDEIKEETIYTQKRVKDLLSYARSIVETEARSKGVPLSVIDASFNPDKDMQGVYVLPLDDFYEIALPAVNGKLSEADVSYLESLFDVTRESMSNDKATANSGVLEAIESADDENAVAE